ncbi:MAG TPA: hypothetical protein DCQ31_13135 [Bacteroidales bacterium]|nr:hypothetical protein [Bacteroidales bacterium]
MKGLYKLLFIVLPVALIGACTGENSQTKEAYLLQEAADSAQFGIGKVKKVIYSFPSPHEVTLLLTEQAGAKFSESFLFPLNRIDAYITSGDKAFLLGVLSTDMNFAGLYKQNQTSLNYLDAVVRISDNLGVNEPIADSLLRKLEKGMINKEDMLKLFSENYMTLENFLKENERGEQVAILLAGGWIEGLYLAIKIAEQSDTVNEKLAERIAGQSISMNSLLSYCEDYRNTPYVNKMHGDLVKLNEKFIELNKISSDDNLHKTSAYNELTKAIEKFRNSFLEISQN